MLSPVANQTPPGSVSDAETDRQHIIDLRLENGRLRKRLAELERRLREAWTDAAKAQHESQRQQTRVENAMCWAEERRIDFLRVCAERDLLSAEVARHHSNSSD